MAEAPLDLPYLRDYWERQRRGEKTRGETWSLDQTLLSGLHLGLLETIRALTAHANYESFVAWVLAANGGALEPARLDRLRRALAGERVEAEVPLEGVPGLTADELAHWDEQGYVVVRGAVTPEQAHAAGQAIYDFLGADPDEPESWYRPERGHSIWVSLLRHPAFFATRRSPRLVKAFAQLWGREDLWSSIDQGGLNPPERADWPFPGPHMHWDTTLAAPHVFGLQGILYLNDVAADQGAFACVPGFHKRLKPWLASLPPGTDPRVAIHDAVTMTPIAASAGDLVIWNNLLPHGATPNRSSRPRVAQYITLRPSRTPHTDVWF